MHTLRCRSIFRECQRRFMHAMGELRSRPKDSRQRHKQHRPHLRSMHDGAIFYRVQPEHLRELDRMQCHHRSGKQRRFCHRG
eukprot:g3402.t1